MALGVVAALGGCGVAELSAKRDAQIRYAASSQSYRDCVVARGEAGCAKERSLMETDAQIVSVHTGAVVTVQSR